MSDTEQESEFESADEGEATGDLEQVTITTTTTTTTKTSNEENESILVSQLTSGLVVNNIDQKPTDDTKEDEENVKKVNKRVEESNIEQEITKNVEETTHKNKSEPSQLTADVSLNDAKKNDGWELEDEEDVTLSNDLEPQEEGDDNEHSREVTPTRKLDSRKSSVSSVKDQSVLDRLNDAAQSNHGSSWGFSNWGTSLLATASSSVSTLTTQLGQGLNTVLDTVESTLGAPSPEEFAAAEHKNCDENTERVDVSEGENSEWHGQESNLFGSSIGSLGSKMITGGLDTLELIGRKTMDILQEGDPGLKKKRELLKTEKPSLSEVLREAKEKAKEVISLNTEDKSKELVNFGTIFDEQQGLVHLEALEMLSKQCEQKVQLTLLDLTGDELQYAQTQLAQIEERCALELVDDAVSDTDENDTCSIELKATHFEKINVVVNLEKLLKTQADGKLWLRSCLEEQEKGIAKDAAEIYEHAISFLAQFTAKSIEVLHKVCELLLVSADGNINEEIDHLTGFGNSCCSEVSALSSKYSSCLNIAADDSEDPDSIGPLITNVFLEASNSTTYIQDVFLLVIPIFKHKLLNKQESS